MFLLASNSLDRLLPTILSRCRKFALPMPAQQEALAWLQAQGCQGRRRLAARAGRRAAGGAWPRRETGNREEMDELLQMLAQPSIEGALKTADSCRKRRWPRWSHGSSAGCTTCFLSNFRAESVIIRDTRRNLQRWPGTCTLANCCGTQGRERAPRDGRPSAVGEAVHRRHVAGLHGNSAPERSAMTDMPANPDCTPMTRRNVARPSVLSLAIKEKAALYAAYMPFLKNGGMFVPTNKAVQDRRRNLPDPDADGRSEQIPDRRQNRVDHAGRRQQQQGARHRRAFPGDESGQRVKLRIEEILGAALRSSRATHTL